LAAREAKKWLQFRLCAAQTQTRKQQPATVKLMGQKAGQWQATGLQAGATDLKMTGI
jgi:hypothetical protein